MVVCLVTGGAGFIGSTLVRALLEIQHEVVVIDNFARGKRSLLPQSERLSVVSTDVRDSPGIRRLFSERQPSHVFHLAAIHFIQDCEADPDGAMATNVDGTRNVAQAALEVGVEAVLHASTSAVYRRSGRPFVETDPLSPIDVYGRTKVRAEELLQDTLEEAHLEIVRLFNVYGPRETNPHVLPEILDQLRSDSSEVLLGDLSPTRDFIFVEDVASIMVALAFSQLAGLQTTNLGTGVGTTVRQLADLAMEVTGRRKPVVADEARIRQVDRPHLVANTTRLLSRVAIELVPLHDGLAATWRSMIG